MRAPFKRVLAVICAAVTIPLGAARCVTGDGLPVHTRTWWLTRAWPPGTSVVILQPGVKPPGVRIDGRPIPGAWTKRGETYIGDHVWEWRPGYPNGQH
jgi:hypothetical protein